LRERARSPFWTIAFSPLSPPISSLCGPWHQRRDHPSSALVTKALDPAAARRAQRGAPVSFSGRRPATISIAESLLEAKRLGESTTATNRDRRRRRAQQLGGASGGAMPAQRCLHLSPTPNHSLELTLPVERHDAGRGRVR
jgi:hypothetical protein